MDNFNEFSPLSWVMLFLYTVMLCSFVYGVVAIVWELVQVIAGESTLRILKNSKKYYFIVVPLLFYAVTYIIQSLIELN